MTGNDTRQLFIDYFAKNAHQHVRSSSLVPSDDPTLLFTNAGMVQFKRLFMGEDKRKYTTAVTSQKCVRAGGKHNDLENVGYTARHHTFFEMLGNFSFGDYFKEKAIELGWDLLTNGYKLPTDKLWVSIFLDDDEAYDIWRNKIGIPDNRIVRLGEKDNFWAMGDTGPCGPCSEIHIDRGDKYSCDNPDCGVDCDCDRFLEIWNLVFMQFYRDENGTMTRLPKPSIDTGMGLERLSSVLQDVATNYDTDLFTPIMHRVADLSGKSIGASFNTDVAMKVIADHSRAAAFLIGDGILPSNEGRGYVLRRIMRRAIRYGRNLGLVKPFLHETARVVFDIMEGTYPELKAADAFITNVIQNEEMRFSETLDKGLGLLNETLSEMKEKGQTEVPGQVMFKLYDTYGFPVDIVRDVVKDSGLDLDMDGFNSAMHKQKEQSRSKVHFAGTGAAFRELGASGVTTEFTGYSKIEDNGKILVLAVNGEAVESASAGTKIEIVTDKTPFYAESGGQAGDCGTIKGEGGLEIQITDTIKDPTGFVIHKGEVKTGTATSGIEVSLMVDQEKRRLTALNHTATHILHSALHHLVGDHVKQAGSLVSSERLRFDFTHFAQVDRDTIEAIEKFVNERICDNTPVEIEEMDAEAAFKSGATALFEEKYGDRVRVVSMSDFSKEFCGGTHTSRTGNIGFFKILTETSVAAGIRRIEAVTSSGALKAVQETNRKLFEAASIFRDSPDNLISRIEKTLADQKATEKELQLLKSKIAAASLDSIEDDIKVIAGIKTVIRRVDVEDQASMRDLADKYKDKLGSGVIVLASESDGKVMLIAMVTKNLTAKFKAGDIVKQIAPVVGGGGGGRPDMAQAGGSKPEMIADALKKAAEIIAG
ncbi:alanine--tRNA ligase [Desulforegula conservatrix]|uniref:alanine--tRNA ligase n=1 Tax=Desulforegula conservatrix TaxID=153026 RepID=UPI000482FAFE|nr:alanine--tRNA ligase [Desulforegula conservatrix]